MTDFIASNIAVVASYAAVWGFLLIFIFMTIESSFIPFPSEVVMIPAGFLAYRHELSFGVPVLDLIVAIAVGLAGSMGGAYINYYLSAALGRPLLHRYGKYFFLKEQTLDRAEEIFRQYGDVATFVCRLLPAIRQLISIPAGLSKMNIWRFSLFTALGAGVWILILTLVGWYLASLAGTMSYEELVTKGAAMIHDNYLWILLGLAIFVAGYCYIHHKVMKTPVKSVEQ